MCGSQLVKEMTGFHTDAKPAPMFGLLICQNSAGHNSLSDGIYAQLRRTVSDDRVLICGNSAARSLTKRIVVKGVACAPAVIRPKCDILSRGRTTRQSDK